MMRRTWRGTAARVNWYFLEGNTALVQAKNVIYVSAALKILGAELWLLILLAPVIYALHVLAGWVWVRHGWFREMNEVSTTDSASPVAQWQLYMNLRLYHHLNLPINGMDLRTMPEELRHVLTSFHKGVRS